MHFQGEICNFAKVIPDPPTLAFFFVGKKIRETPKKARVVLFAETPKSLEKKGKTVSKKGKIGKGKKRKSTEKTKGRRVRDDFRVIFRK